MNNDLYAVIMAGGRGTRFWPVSTAAMPKQFLQLTGDRTMLQETAERFSGLCDRSRIMVVTGAAHADTVRAQLPWIRRENLLLEPEGRNTAACIGWAAETLVSRGAGSALMAVVPSDHVIDGPEGFRRTMEKAAVPAEQGSLVTVGIEPDRPATGYGYLEIGESEDAVVHRVLSFREKPDRCTAEDYVKSGNYLWNAGMFVWRADVIMREISVHIPQLYESLKKLGNTLEPASELYGSLPSISIDYGVMEKSDNVCAVPAEFGWTDVGDWPSARKCGIGRGRVMKMDSSGSTVWNPDKLTVLLGVSNISVVETDSATLVMSDEYAQKLKEMVKLLEKERPDLV